MHSYFPHSRPRRNRVSAAIRDGIAESFLTTDHFLVPLFVQEGNNKSTEIASMPGYFRYTLDLLLAEVEACMKMGLNKFLLFAKVEEEFKDNAGKHALDENGLMQRAISAIKTAFPECYLMSDIALDPYSKYGHDGIVEGQKIVNDATIAVLAEMSLSHAAAGVDCLAPSDMMDGRIVAIREALEGNDFPDVGIMAYSAKYASAFYGPFRVALDSAPGFGDKKTYQMDPRNLKEGVREAVSDEYEGADIIMVKPGMPYLDVVRSVKDAVSIPVSVYQVSGEYAMIKAASEKGWLNHDQVMLESLMAFRRAGADLIASYFAKEFAKISK